MTNFVRCIADSNLTPKNVYIELIEDFHDISIPEVKKVCSWFSKYGFSFSADDFGVESQNHQVILELGKYIKEIKLDPMSFQFKHTDKVHFLDNLAFLEYCKKLADHREAIITAEAVKDYRVLQFLISNQIYYFQANILCKKLKLQQYKEQYQNMQQLEEKFVNFIFNDKTWFKKIKYTNNIFSLAKEYQSKKL